MAEPHPRDATQLLSRLQRGDEEAAEELLPLVEGELHRIAERLMQDQRTGHTLQPTALVNEAWMKLAGADRTAPWESTAHFLRLAARAMRSVLVDHARGRAALKRGRRAEVEDGFLERWCETVALERHDLLAVHEALERLAELDPEGVQVVELRFFAGLTIPETARALEVSSRTVERKWRALRAWLRGEIEA